MKIKTTVTVAGREPVMFDDYIHPDGPVAFSRVLRTNKKVTVEKFDGTVIVYENLEGA